MGVFTSANGQKAVSTARAGCTGFSSDARRESCTTPEVPIYRYDTSRIGGEGEQHGRGAKEPAITDFELEWMFAEYGECRGCFGSLAALQGGPDDSIYELFVADTGFFG